MAIQLTSMGGGVGHLKAGFLGFNKSGKSYTAALLASGTRREKKLDGAVMMFDTEPAAQYIAPIIKMETGKDLVGFQSRSLADACEFIREAMKAKASVLIIDSVTHLWRETCDSYLAQINKKAEDRAKAAGQQPKKRTRLEFQDWGPIKSKWAEFSDLYVNSPIDIIICGRAGYEYDYEDREDGTGKDLIKTGVKMKTEGEFGFEPSLLIQMERVQVDALGNLQNAITHRCTIIGDRFNVIDGKTCDNPTYDFFAPHVKMLTPGAVVAVNTTNQTDHGVNNAGDADWTAERKGRVILSEEIKGLLTHYFPGQSAESKKETADAIFECFGTRSWTAVENTDTSKLRFGLDKLQLLLKNKPKKEEVVK